MGGKKFSAIAPVAPHVGHASIADGYALVEQPFHRGIAEAPAAKPPVPAILDQRPAGKRQPADVRRGARKFRSPDVVPHDTTF